MKITLNELRKIVRSVLKEAVDPKRVTFFNNLTNEISKKIINKKILFGKIGVFDNASIIIQKYADRDHSVNLEGEQVTKFSIMYYVRMAEEDLYKSEKPGTRIWSGILDIEATYNVSGGLNPKPNITLYPVKDGTPNFSNPITPTVNITWAQLGGETGLWKGATTFNRYS